MRFQRDILKVYFIMGSQNTAGNLLEVLTAAIRGGITCFQFREKGRYAKTGTERLHLGLSLRKICREHQIPFIVNDDIELALKLDADGIHVGQDDIPINELRQQIPPHYLIGLSTSTIEESVEAQRLNVDYIGVGPINNTATKEDALQAIGLNGLQKIREQTHLPIVAIGGITVSDVKPIVEHGADGVAVISEISQSENPEMTTRQIRENIKPLSSNELISKRINP